MAIQALTITDGPNVEKSREKLDFLSLKLFSPPFTARSSKMEKKMMSLFFFLFN